jgi:hypothetical protein
MFFENSLRLEIECDGFRKITPEVWLPTRMSVTDFAVKGFMPDEYAGRAIVRHDYKFTRLEANAADHEHLFAFDPEAGSLIIDETLVPEGQKGAIERADGSRGTPTVSYVVPADKDDLDAVIAQAVRDQTGKDWWPLGFWTTVLLVNAVILVVGYSIVRRRIAAR